jgi:hypothetical protein
MPSASVNRGLNKPVGVFLMGDMDVIVEDNTFENYNNQQNTETNSANFNYGIVVRNCAGTLNGSNAGAGKCLLYHNNFTNLNTSIQSEGDNKGMFDPLNVNSVGGMQFRCNTFYQRLNYDVTVTKDQQTLDNGLIRNQGICDNLYPQKQAGNTYLSTNCTEEQLYFDGQTVIDDNFDFEYSDRDILLNANVLNCTNIQNSIIGCQLASNNPCNPSTYCPTLPCIRADYFDNVQQSAVVQDDYKLSLDGGDTQWMKLKAECADTNGTLATLLMKSPYLSDEVLLAMLGNSSLKPDVKSTILMQNSGLSSKVLKSELMLSLNDSFRNLVLAAQNRPSARMEKEAELNEQYYQTGIARVRLIQKYLEMDELDSLETLTARDTSLMGLFDLLEVQSVDAATAAVAASTLEPATITLNKIEEREGANPSSKNILGGIALALKRNGKSWFDMDSTQLQTVWNIYNHNPTNEVYARAVLVLTKGLRYERYPLDLNGTQERRMIQNILQTTKENFKLAIYPNPSSDLVKIALPKETTSGNCRVTIYNAQGMAIDELKLNIGVSELNYSVSNLNNGIYFCLYLENECVKDKVKLVVTH